MVGARHVVAERDRCCRADEHGACVAERARARRRRLDDQQQVLRGVLVRERDRVRRASSPRARRPAPRAPRGRCPREAASRARVASADTMSSTRAAHSSSRPRRRRADRARPARASRARRARRRRSRRRARAARSGRRANRSPRRSTPAASPRRRTRCPVRRCDRRAARSPCRRPSRRSRPHRRARRRGRLPRAPPRRARRSTAGRVSRDGRRAEDDLADAGHARRNDAHQHAARIRGAPAGRIHADASERIGPTADDHARLALRLLCDRAESAVHALDVLRRTLERAVAGVAAGCRAPHCHRARGTSSESSVDAVELERRARAGRRRRRADPRDDARGALADRRVDRRRAIEQRAAIRALTDASQRARPAHRRAASLAARSRHQPLDARDENALGAERLEIGDRAVDRRGRDDGVDGDELVRRS